MSNTKTFKRIPSGMTEQMKRGEIKARFTTLYVSPCCQKDTTFLAYNGGRALRLCVGCGKICHF